MCLPQKLKLFTPSTQGTGWVENNDWLGDEDVCKWYGVEECNGGGMVTALALRSNNLIGTLPIEVSHLRMVGAFFSFLVTTDNE